MHIYPIKPKKTPDKDLPFIEASEVRKRDGKDGNQLLIVVDEIVLDCTAYISKHPGGREIIKGFAGQNASWQWWTFHSRTVWNDVAVTLRVGRTSGIENRFVKPPAFVGLRPFGYQDD